MIAHNQSSPRLVNTKLDLITNLQGTFHIAQVNYIATTDLNIFYSKLCSLILK